MQTESYYADLCDNSKAGSRGVLAVLPVSRHATALTLDIRLLTSSKLTQIGPTIRMNMYHKFIDTSESKDAISMRIQSTSDNKTFHMTRHIVLFI